MLGGQAAVSVALAPAYPTGAALLQHITTTALPALAPIAASLILAVNEEYVDFAAPIALSATDTLALIPPLSGG